MEKAEETLPRQDVTEQIKRLVVLVADELDGTKRAGKSRLQAGFESVSRRLQMGFATRYIMREEGLARTGRLDDDIAAISRHARKSGDEVRKTLGEYLDDFLPEVRRIENSVREENAGLAGRIDISRRCPLPQPDLVREILKYGK